MYVLEHSQHQHFEQTMQGYVERTIAGDQSGRVRVMGVSWMARLSNPDTHAVLTPGMPITVLGRRGNTLLVLPSEAD